MPMSEEEMIVAVRALVKESFENVLGDATEQRMQSIQEAAKPKEEKDPEGDEEEGDDKADGKDTVEEDEDTDEDTDEDEDKDDEKLEEALDVDASFSHVNGKGEKLVVANLRELAKLAKTGKYQAFAVTNKRTGEDSDYIVEKGKLVLM